MSEEDVQSPGLVPFRCPVCGKLLAWAISRAKCRCPVCKKWFRYAEGKVSAGA
ncbi:hypothetical protein HSX37_09275|uniref:Uncharacterized protein n=1 Tax=Dendrosporobacter quercicolus TaxID=146817 RepID=A0A1G9QF42_9FIRM|nr:hypothetical protein [Dendrosporobacter quercicolus]NSL48219.1 hypothetical protein [Dendrosporobacter quercicolus DSM 1736]SDM09510.1 hypothetical protein SAMN04488502_102148 [Dendrosporobacter quercicolus]